MNFFVKLKTNLIVDALVLIAVGAILIFLPGTTLNILTKAIGILVLAAGVLSILSSLIAKEQNVITRNGSIGFGLVIAVVGMWILINPEFFESIIPVIAGVIMLFSGFMNLGETLSLGKSKYNNWWVALILALITIAAGGFLLFKPLTSMAYVVQIIGGFLAYNGLSNLWIMSRIHKVDKMSRKELGENVRTGQGADKSVEIIDVESKDLD